MTCQSCQRLDQKNVELQVQGRICVPPSLTSISSCSVANLRHLCLLEYHAWTHLDRSRAKSGSMKKHCQIERIHHVEQGKNPPATPRLTTRTFATSYMPPSDVHRIVRSIWMQLPENFDNCHLFSSTDNEIEAHFGCWHHQKKFQISALMHTTWTACIPRMRKRWIVDVSWCSCAQGSTQLVAPGISQMPNHANNVAISQPKSQQGRDKHPHKSSIHRRHFWIVCEYINLYRALVVGLGKLANRPRLTKKSWLLRIITPFKPIQRLQALS